MGHLYGDPNNSKSFHLLYFLCSRPRNRYPKNVLHNTAAEALNIPPAESWRFSLSIVLLIHLLIPLEDNSHANGHDPCSQLLSKSEHLSYRTFDAAIHDTLFVCLLSRLHTDTSCSIPDGHAVGKTYCPLYVNLASPKCEVDL